MHFSNLSEPIPAEAHRVALEDWDLLFETVLTRLRDTLVRDASGHPVCPVVLECVETLEKLRHSHP